MTRKHVNTSRLTARERAEKIRRDHGLTLQTCADIERAFQAHAREAMDRLKRRQAK